MKKNIFPAVMLSIYSTCTFAAPPQAPVLKSKVLDAEASLSWKKVEGATGYALYYSKTPYQGVEHVFRIDQGNSDSYKAILPVDANYLVAVKAYNAKQEESAYSNIETVAVSQAQVTYMSLNRQKYDKTELKEGEFQLLVDIRPEIKPSKVEFLAPDNSSYGDLNIKADNQAELFVEAGLASIEAYLLAGNYKINNQEGEKLTDVTIKNGAYPSFPKIVSPIHNATNVKIKPTITFKSQFPTTISVTDTTTNKEVFFARDLKTSATAGGGKSVKPEGLNLKPNTRYLLEINQTNKAVAKGSTTVISFTTK
jgi:hypothetical protein